MKNMIDAIYQADMEAKQNAAPSKEYRKALKAADNAEDAFERNLTLSQRDKFDAVLCLRLRVAQMDARQAYHDGFRAACRLLRGILSDQE